MKMKDIPTTRRKNFPMYIILLCSFLIRISVYAQPYPNPYREVGAWAKLPDSREMGAVGDVDIDPTGEYIYAVVRCEGAENFGSECLDSDLDPILKFNQDGELVQSFGGGMFIWPHGLEIDKEGNVWVTDAVKDDKIAEGDTRGHKIVKFSPSGEVLMVMGNPGKRGDGNNQFNTPSDLAIADNGDIFVVDGHSTGYLDRVLKYSKDGTFIKSWGSTGYGPGEFQNAHAIAIDKRGRVFIADRGNNRIQIFDQEGNFISQWTQFGKPSGIFFDEHDNIYVSDSESDNEQNPGWEMGIRIGDAHMGWVHYFVPLPDGDPRVKTTNGAEFVAVDKYGNMYGGEPGPRKLKKYVRVRK